MAMTDSTVAGSRRVTWRRLGMPALLTRMSTPPSCSRASAARRSTAASSVRSRAHMAESGAWTRQRSSTSARRSWRRAAIPTVAPRRRSASARPAPIPDDPPVISTRSPSNGPVPSVMLLPRRTTPSLRRVTRRVVPDGTPTTAAHRFFHSGARFSANALGPSTASSLANTSEEMDDSIL